MWKNFRYFSQELEISLLQRRIQAKNQWENRSVSFLCRLLLWRFTKISKYGFCTAQNIHQSTICYRSFQEIFKSDAECWLTYKFPVQQLRLLRPRNSALLLERKYQQLFYIKKLCYYPRDKTKIVLSLTLTSIEHFNAELRQN